MPARSATTRIAAALPIALIGLLLFYVSGAALLAHRAVAHPAPVATPATADHPHAPADHSRSCDVDHMLHGIVASAPPAAPLPPVAVVVARSVPEAARIVPVRAPLHLRSRAPPAA